MSRPSYLLIIVLLIFSNGIFGQKEVPTIGAFAAHSELHAGFFDFYWDSSTGSIYLQIHKDQLDKEFLYVSSLSHGVGSNDIGLDRNQLGLSRVVRFRRIGSKVLLEHMNYDYRAETDNLDEARSVYEAFASSVLSGFEIIASSSDGVLIDMSSLLMSDAHGVADRLRLLKQGTYCVDAERSGINIGRSKSFPKNTDFDVLLTFSGTPESPLIRSVTPSPKHITVGLHHSFVALPDGDYTPRKFHPACGYFSIEFDDFGTPINMPLRRRYISRHRLEKKHPDQALSEPVEPIIYYLDRGTPEPIRSALLEGASWWNEAFEAAGFKDAFRVQLLPEGIDPLDVRYNMINWVHRSTRGWSYGASVIDPRTGEIIKGHVLLGSLRVRQDFLIAQGLLAAYGDTASTAREQRMMDFALSRLRQLSAHEVGHTLGLAHNFAASSQNRESVMDYPHPYVIVDSVGNVDFRHAYTEGIGEWDKRAIMYGYQLVTTENELTAILEENHNLGYRYITDRDARAESGSHPYAHLWDNGDSPVQELHRLIRLREHALHTLSSDNIPMGTPLAELERILVPIYLMTRYQTEAVSKLVGGVHYSYTVKGIGEEDSVTAVNADIQKKALDIVLQTLTPKFLAIPQGLKDIIPPLPPGYDRDRELFQTHTAFGLDPLAMAEMHAENTYRLLCNPARLARIVEQHAFDPDHHFSLYSYLKTIYLFVSNDLEVRSTYREELKRITEIEFVLTLLGIAASDRDVSPLVTAPILKIVKEIYTDEQNKIMHDKDNEKLAHRLYLSHIIEQFYRNPAEFKSTINEMRIPDGSPIGCGH